MSKTRLNGPKALLTATVLALAAPLPAQAQGILDLGKMLLGIENEKPEIEYRERAPLVVPPKTELPAPRERASAANPNWPKDPDVEARKAKEDEKRAPRITRAESDRLTIDEMRAGRRVGPTMPAKPSVTNPWMHPDELRALERKNAALSDGPTSGEEPPRRYLTDPPLGLRKPAPGAPVTIPRGEMVPKWRDEDASPYAIYRR